MLLYVLISGPAPQIEGVYDGYGSRCIISFSPCYLLIAVSSSLLSESHSRDAITLKFNHSFVLIGGVLFTNRAKNLELKVSVDNSASGCPPNTETALCAAVSTIWKS